MKFSLKQIVTAGALLAASTAALADLSVPAAYQNSATAPDGFTTNTNTDGGLVFHLFNTGDTTYSVSYYLGVDLSDVTATEMDDAGLTLTWTINPTLYAGVDLSQMQWGLVAGDNGSLNEGTGSTNLLTTVSASSVTSFTNNGLIPAANLVDIAYSGANTDADPEDVNTIAFNNEDAKSVFSNGNMGIAGFDFTAAANNPAETLAMYLFSQNGGRGTGGNTVNATQYAGLWSFDALTGTLSYSVVSTVPLPAAAWLLLSALGGLGAVGRRRVAA